MQSILETELSCISERHKGIISFWENLAAQGPAWGMIGTLLGHTVLYLGGTLYYSLVYAPDAGFWGGLALCVLPYLLPDAAKAALA